MIHIWFQRLDLLGFLIGLIQSKGQPTQWYAAQASRAAAWLCRLTGRPLTLPPLELGQLDPDGLALRYRTESQLQTMMTGLLTRFADDPAWLPAGHRPFRDAWSRILQSHYQSQNIDTIQFIAIVENEYRTGIRETAERIVINISPRFLGRYMALRYQIAPGLPLTIKALANPVGWLAFGLFPGYALMPLHLAFKAWCAGPARAHVSAPAVVLTQYEQYELQRYPSAGHYSWFPHSGLAADHLVFYCNRPDSPASAENRARIEAAGFGWIDGANPLQHLQSPIRETLALLAGMLRAFPWRGDALARWRWALVAGMLPLLEGLRRMARTHRVVAATQVNECWPRPLLFSVAVQMEQGAFFWSPWAVDHLPSSLHACGLADFMFSWGPWFDGYSRAVGYHHRYSLRTGILGQPGRDPEAKERGLAARRHFSDGVRFVIALFDSSYAPTAHQSEASLRQFLQQMLNATERRPDWGLLYKAKTTTTESLLFSPELAELTARLESRGQLFRLDPMDSPQTAAHGADVVVCYSINSAGFVTAPLLDIPVVHYDICGMTAHPSYQLGHPGSVVFGSFDALTEGLDKIQQGDRGIGRNPDLVSFLDSFGDGLGNQRAGQVVGAYFHARGKGLGNQEALEQTAAAYAEKFGSDNVVAWTHRDSGHQIWRKTMDQLGFPENPLLSDMARTADRFDAQVAND